MVLDFQGFHIINTPVFSNAPTVRKPRDVYPEPETWIRACSRPRDGGFGHVQTPEKRWQTARVLSWGTTVDGRNPEKTTWDVKNLVNHGINYLSTYQLVQDFSHQQYEFWENLKSGRSILSQKNPGIN